jgi:hypothetical protein
LHRKLLGANDVSSRQHADNGFVDDVVLLTEDWDEDDPVIAQYALNVAYEELFVETASGLSAVTLNELCTMHSVPCCGSNANTSTAVFDVPAAMVPKSQPTVLTDENIEHDTPSDPSTRS